MRLTIESKRALPAARAWLDDYYDAKYSLTIDEVIGDIDRHYPGGWPAFLEHQ